MPRVAILFVDQIGKLFILNFKKTLSTRYFNFASVDYKHGLKLSPGPAYTLYFLHIFSASFYTLLFFHSIFVGFFLYF